MSRDEVIARFHPLIAEWFTSRVGTPTEVQALAWPVIAAGEHVLVTAPTGSGKTLTAFLWALNQLIAGAWPTGAMRVLYVSPLKALNNDIQRNLLGPLSQLREHAAEVGFPLPAIEVMTRSGDTSSRDRRRQARRPPEILITTPESLNLLLNSAQAAHYFGELRTVILDEIHAVAGSKRGTHLITAVERLVPLAGEFQRISLSATVHPLETVAAFVGGYRRLPGDPPTYTPRPVRILAAPRAKRYECEVLSSGADVFAEVRGSPYVALTAELKQIIRGNRSTLIFVNSRRHCERITSLLNQAEAEPIAYSHHGSLSRETREVVEQRLKSGQLKAIVATGTLELGIDIGSLDEVVLVETPPAASAAIQRVGRAGHGVGQVSRGRLYPLGGRDCVDAAVIGRCLVAGEIEPLRPVRGPLDVLAQLIIAACAARPREIDDLHAEIRCAWPYQDLSRAQFDRVLAMLAGRYAGTRLRELEPRVIVDRVAGTITSGPAGRYLVQTSGGTIPDRGLFHLRAVDSHQQLGELDEEFVWERRVGDVFSFGTRSWLIESITHNDVFVSPAGSKPTLPFWKGEGIQRDWYFAERVGQFLETAEARLGDARWPDELRREYALDPGCIRELEAFLRRQRGHTQAPLPHRHHLLIERLETPTEAADAYQIVLHTLWGGRVNYPFGLALAGACEAEFGVRVELHVHNDGVALMLPDRIGTDELLALVDPERVEEQLRARLEETGFFGARFRENAGRALLLTRGSPNQRLPLWLNRQRSLRLLDAVAKYGDFPILVETWRCCLHDEFELDPLRRLLGELRAGTIAVSECRTVEPSPFAERLAWRQINYLMYLDDTPAGRASSLSAEILREAVFEPHLRPEIDPALVAALEAKLRRTHPGYAPREPLELLELLCERIVVTAEEWEELAEAVRRDHGADLHDWVEALPGRVARRRLPGASCEVVLAVESGPLLAAALAVDLGLPAVAAPEELDGDPLERLVAAWLQFRGPVVPARLTEVLGLGADRFDPVLDTLEDDQRLVRDRLTRGAGEVEICDADNLERLLAAVRRGARPEFEPLPIARLAPFIARRQGLLDRGTGGEALRDALEPLLGLGAPADLWETEILPARVEGYRPEWLDELLRTTDLRWLGAGERRVVFAFDEQRELFGEPEEAPAEPLIPTDTGRYALGDLCRLTGRDARAVGEALWADVWAQRAVGDSFEAIRRGLATQFRAAAVEPGVRRRRPVGRGSFARGQPAEVHWFRPRPPEPPADALEALELDRDRVRMLLERYGVIFRELAAREAPALRWQRLFRACRLMELAGEVLCGAFFGGIPGIQFTSPDGFRALTEDADDQAIFWLCAADPASLCGLKLPGLDDLPDRRVSAHVVYLGGAPALVSTAGGKQLRFAVRPDHPRFGEVIAVLGEQQARVERPRRGLVVERINGEPATHSEYLPALRRHLDVTVDARQIRLWRRV